MYAISISHESILLAASWIIGLAFLIAIFPIAQDYLKKSGKSMRDTLFDQSLGMIILGIPFWLLSFTNPLESLLILAYVLWWVGIGVWMVYFSPKTVSENPIKINEFRARLLLAIQYSGVIPIAGIFWSPRNLPPYLRGLTEKYETMRIRMGDNRIAPPPLSD